MKIRAKNAGEKVLWALTFPILVLVFHKTMKMLDVLAELRETAEEIDREVGDVDR
jgi:hypothetical protein